MTIAKQIQIHKQVCLLEPCMIRIYLFIFLCIFSQKKNKAPFSHTKSPPLCSSQQTVSSHAPNVAPLPSQSQHLFPPPQQHISTTATSTPHLALMQYNLPANNVMATNTAPAAAPAVAATASAYPPGYLAVPYSSMQELQMRMQPSLVPIPTAQLQLGSGGIQVMKPVMAISDNNVVGLNLGLQMIGGVNGGLHPSLQQQQPHLASLAAPGHHHLTHTSSAGVLPGPGSWGVAPIQSVNNCVFNHNFQPGIMTTPWVK